MSLRFFADHCVPSSVAQAVQKAGHEVFRLRHHLRSDSPDGIVIAKAQELDCILLSLDGDFADIVTYPPTRYKGIVALQLRNHPEVMPQLLERLMAYLSLHDDMGDYAGKLLVVQSHRIRTR